MSDQLPNGWATPPLRDVVSARKGKKPVILHESNAPGRLPYLLIDQMEGRPARHFTDDSKITVASKDEVLVVWDRSIGKCATGLEGAVGSTIVALKPVIVETNFLHASSRIPGERYSRQVVARDSNILTKKSSGTCPCRFLHSGNSNGSWRNWRRFRVRWTPASSGWRRFPFCSNAFDNRSSLPPAPVASR